MNELLDNIQQVLNWLIMAITLERSYFSYFAGTKKTIYELLYANCSNCSDIRRKRPFFRLVFFFSRFDFSTGIAHFLFNLINFVY